MSIAIAGSRKLWKVSVIDHHIYGDFFKTEIYIGTNMATNEGKKR
jgi:hypothetical protein